MPNIGVRELKARASEIVREIREEHARYVITHRGRPVGLLLPIEETNQITLEADSVTGESAWDELVRLGEEIGQGWQSSKTSTKLLSDMRR